MTVVKTTGKYHCLVGKRVKFNLYGRTTFSRSKYCNTEGTITHVTIDEKGYSIQWDNGSKSRSYPYHKDFIEIID